MSSDISHVGLRLLNRYFIEEPLPAGALCRVYRGQDTVLRRSIAVKAVPPERVELYRGALHASAALSHPAVVATYDALDEDGWLFIIQEYVTARPLASYLRDGVPSERAVNLGGQIARAIAYAHAHHFSHGDLTPAAVLVDRQATAHINNFRLPADAEYFADRASEWDITPERLLPPDGDPARADITAAGLLLWMLLSEMKRPATGDDAAPDVRRKFRADVREPLCELVRRCVRQDEAGAIPSADALCQELEELSREMATSHAVVSEQTPPALRVARATVAQGAPWSAETTLGGIRSWGPMHAGDPVSQNAPTIPQTTDAAPWLTSVPTASIAPRLRLPSRPVPDDEMDGYVPARNARSLTATEHAPQRVTSDAAAGGQIRLWVLVVIGLALFILFFLIGLNMPYRL